MSKIFGILAAVALAISALLFFKNKEAKQQEAITYEKSQKVEESTTKELNDLQTFLAGTEEEDLLAETKDAEAELESLIADNEQAKKDVVKFTDEYEAKSEKLSSIEEVKASLPNPETVVPKINRMRSDLTETTDALASEEARLASLAQRDKNGKARIASTRNLLRLRSSGESFPTLKTRISSVYRNWGFVILADGDRAGVVTGSTLDVVRGDEVIAKLKVTAVEAGRASADVILDSVVAGVTIQAGDAVVAEPSTKTAVNK